MATESLYNTSFKVNGESYTVTFDSSFSNYIYAKDENGKMVRFDKNDPLLSFQQKENPNLINYEEKIAETQAKIKNNNSLLKEHKQSWTNAIKEKMNFSWQMHQCKIEAGTCVFENMSSRLQNEYTSAKKGYYTNVFEALHYSTQQSSVISSNQRLNDDIKFYKSMMS